LKAGFTRRELDDVNAPRGLTVVRTVDYYSVRTCATRLSSARNFFGKHLVASASARREIHPLLLSRRHTRLLRATVILEEVCLSKAAPTKVDAPVHLRRRGHARFIVFF